MTLPLAQGSQGIAFTLGNVIKKILKHLGLWDAARKPMPRANAPPIDVFPAYDQPPAPTADDYLTDPDYPVEAYF